jgi:hypothetical protein
MPWINFKHLSQAAHYSLKKPKSFISAYLWHFVISVREGCILLVISLLSFVHAIFPWLIDFELLKWRIKLLKRLKQNLPEDPNLKKIEFNNDP